jgi:flagellar motor protein MotB
LFDKELFLAPALRIPSDGELILSVYFDFDRAHISKESIEALDALLADKGVNMLSEVSVLGYADELGTDRYNMRLSERRAENVAHHLLRGGFGPKIFVEGRGRLVLPEYDYSEVSPLSTASVENPLLLPIADRIKLLRKARRVDIYVKKQQ